MCKPSKQTYDALQSAFDHFNKALWDGQLPQALIVLHRKKTAHGYYWPSQWEAKDGGESLDEIALNPESLVRYEREALSTLVHEMAHHWQQHFGQPSRKGYHNGEWAAEMDRIGLTPSSTAEPGGKRTGQRVSHYVAEDGAYAKAYTAWRSKGKINWSAVSHETGKTEKNKTKTKFSCPSCDQTAWGKAELQIACGVCCVPMVTASA